jgi:hypothetical protein
MPIQTPAEAARRPVHRTAPFVPRLTAAIPGRWQIQFQDKHQPWRSHCKGVLQRAAELQAPTSRTNRLNSYTGSIPHHNRIVNLHSVSEEDNMIGIRSRPTLAKTAEGLVMPGAFLSLHFNTVLYGFNNDHEYTRYEIRKVD